MSHSQRVIAVCLQELTAMNVIGGLAIPAVVEEIIKRVHNKRRLFVARQSLLNSADGIKKDAAARAAVKYANRRRNTNVGLVRNIKEIEAGLHNDCGNVSKEKRRKKVGEQ